MNCEWTEKISLLIDGELPDAETRALQRHLLDCGECQQARADFLNLRSQISNYVPSLSQAAQADALNRVLGRQQAPVRVALPKPKRDWIWSFNPRVAAFASLILFAAILGFVVYRAVQRKETPPAEITKSQPSPIPAPSKGTTPQQVGSDNVAGNQNATPSPLPRTPKRQRVERQATSNVVAVNNATPEVETNSNAAPVGSGDIQALTAIHLERSELLLRAFRNVRTTNTGQSEEIRYERKQARQLIVRNMMLKREADVSGDVQVSSLLENLEPILLDIANLPDKAAADDIRVINERVERKNIVALLQVNSTVLAKALDDDD